MNGWNGDKTWSDKFTRDIKALLGIALIGEASVEDDQQRNTDLIVLTVNAMRVGCRVRRPFDRFGNSTYKRYGHEFTIRAARGSGAKTELAKILDNWGDYFFYGISNDQETGFRCWGIGKLDVFRQWYASGRGTRKKNIDGSSEFEAFRWAELPSGFVLAQRDIPGVPETVEPDDSPAPWDDDYKGPVVVGKLTQRSLL